MARVVLLANDAPGVEVARFLVARGDEVVRLYLHDEARRRRGQDIVAAAGDAEVCDAAQLRDPAHVVGLDALAPDYLVTVFWAHLLSDAVLATARRSTLNFHPALLPEGRGWFPHVHNIAQGTPAGVTLHAMDAGADTGPIWAQRAVAVRASDTARDLYLRLQAEIVDLFRVTWPRIVAGELEPRPQPVEGGSFFARGDVDALDRLDLDAPTTGRAFLAQLRARSFGDRGFAYFEDEDGTRVHVNVRLAADADVS